VSQQLQDPETEGRSEDVEATPQAAATASEPPAARDGLGTIRPDSLLLGQSKGRSCSVELPDFEGPLDLLLHLVRRHELDILNIPISFVCEKYLEYLALMKALDLEVAGDYLVMAATLAFLKSRELIPSRSAGEVEEQVESEEGSDPREELIARLLEYQKYRAAAVDLDKRPLSGRDVFDRGGLVELPPVDPGLAPITLFRLAEAYQRVLDRARVHKSHEVVLEAVSVQQRMQQLALLLDENPRFEFESLFLERTWSSENELRSMLVVSLMSILELTKLGVIWLRQDTDGAPIIIERRVPPSDMRKLLAMPIEHPSSSTHPDPEGHA